MKATGYRQLLGDRLPRKVRVGIIVALDLCENFESREFCDSGQVDSLIDSFEHDHQLRVTRSEGLSQSCLLRERFVEALELTTESSSLPAS